MYLEQIIGQTGGNSCNSHSRKSIERSEKEEAVSSNEGTDEAEGTEKSENEDEPIESGLISSDGAMPLDDNLEITTAEEI